jgi:hypothetical protein
MHKLYSNTYASCQIRHLRLSFVLFVLFYLHGLPICRSKPLRISPKTPRTDIDRSWPPFCRIRSYVVAHASMKFVSWSGRDWLSGCKPTSDRPTDDFRQLFTPSGETTIRQNIKALTLWTLYDIGRFIKSFALRNKIVRRPPKCVLKERLFYLVYIN